MILTMRIVVVIIQRIDSRPIYIYTYGAYSIILGWQDVAVVANTIFRSVLSYRRHLERV